MGLFAGLFGTTRTTAFSFLLLMTIAMPGESRGQSRNPAGETANYEVDTDRDRTSREIRNGEMHASVGDQRQDPTDGSTYDVVIDYSFQTLTMGRQSGSTTVHVPEQYFSLAFIEDLRRNGEWHGPQFSLRHLGVSDVSTMDGHFYPACDGILIYDIRDAGDDVEDLEITTQVSPGVPVLGAVKLDVSGRYRRIPLKAGADYLAP